MLESIKNNKIKVSFVGGILVIATAYGTCSFDPNEEAIKEAVEEAVEETKEDVKEEPKPASEEQPPSSNEDKVLSNKE